MGCQHPSHPAPSSPTECERGGVIRESFFVMLLIALCLFVWNITQIKTKKFLFPPRCSLCCSLKLECEKLATEKTEIQRHYVMVRHTGHIILHTLTTSAVPSPLNPFHLLAAAKQHPPKPTYKTTHTATHIL